jgi:hypothetical protein
MDAPASLTPHRARIGFIDAARSFAIFGAVYCHVVLAMGVWGQIDNEVVKAVGNLLFRTCAPVFFILTGVLFELVYVRKAAKEGFAPVARRLSIRALQCYAGYAVGLLAALISGRLDQHGFGLALISAGPAPMIGVLWFYCVFMFAAIPLIAMRLRWGPWCLLLVLAGIWLLDPVLAAWLGGGPPTDAWSFFLGKQFGHPAITLPGTGQAVWHSLTLVVFGMVLGHAMLRSQEATGNPLSNRFIWTSIGCCILGAAAFAYLLGVHSLIYGFLATSMPLRMGNHPAYYLLTIPVALAMLTLFRWLHRDDQLRKPWFDPALVLGRRGLLAFTIGNAGVNLIPKGFDPALVLGLGLSLLFMVVFVVVLRLLPGDRTAPSARPAATSA